MPTWKGTAWLRIMLFEGVLKPWDAVCLAMGQEWGVAGTVMRREALRNLGKRLVVSLYAPPF